MTKRWPKIEITFSCEMTSQQIVGEARVKRFAELNTVDANIHTILSLKKKNDCIHDRRSAGGFSCGEPDLNWTSCL